jgi:hypothetical protein
VFPEPPEPEVAPMARDDDVESSFASSPTPILRHRHSQVPNKEDTDNWGFLHIIQFFGGGIYAPNPSTYDPIKILLNAETTEEKDELTEKWRDNKLSELNFVGIVVCKSHI